MSSGIRCIIAADLTLQRVPDIAQLRPLLVRLLNAPCDFRLAVRLVHVVVNIVVSYHQILGSECEILMSIMIRYLEPEFPLWQRILTLEALKLLTDQPLYVFAVSPR